MAEHFFRGELPWLAVSFGAACVVAGSAHAMHAQQFGGPFSTRPEVQVKALDDSVGVHKLLFLASPEDEEV